MCERWAVNRGSCDCMVCFCVASYGLCVSVFAYMLSGMRKDVSCIGGMCVCGGSCVVTWGFIVVCS